MDNLDKEFDAMRDRIFSLLKEQKITQKDFAQAIQVSPQTITDWKKGKSHSFSTMLSVIAPALHTSPAWIYFGEGNKFLSDEKRLELESQERERIQKTQAILDTQEKETKQYVINAFRQMMDRNGFSPSEFAIDTIEHLAKNLGTTAEYLLTGEGPKTRIELSGTAQPDFIVKYNQLTPEGQKEVLAFIEFKQAQEASIAARGGKTVKKPSPASAETLDRLSEATREAADQENDQY